MEQEWKISSEIWRNRGLISGEVSIYLKKMCIAAVGYFLGILIECYVNPLIIDIILKYIKIF
jgi:stage II sporulation protein M